MHKINSYGSIEQTNIMSETSMSITILLCCCGFSCLGLRLADSLLCGNMGSLDSACRQTMKFTIPMALLAFCAACVFGVINGDLPLMRMLGTRGGQSGL